MQLNEVKGKVDFGIITIREDEFEAVLARFPSVGRVSGRRHYNLRQVDFPGGDSYLIAVLRCIEQGNGEAQSAAHDLLEELAPRWLLVVGIAGGIPSDEFSLGDVIVSTRVHDFSVEAVIQERKPEYALAGGPVDMKAAVLVANIPALRAELQGWNTEQSIIARRPETNISEATLYGDESWRDRVRGSLARQAGRTHPTVLAGAIASSDRLMKDTEALTVWTKMARQVLAVEMESAGVYRATYGRHVPTVSIRGVSDIVGLKRDPSWTLYACHTAAAFALALVRTRPFEPRNRSTSGVPGRAENPESATSRPRVFIGASSKGLPAAEFIQLGLDTYAECTIWSQEGFGLPEGSMEGLARAGKDVDLAVLVLSADDLVHARGGPHNARDNVLLELGFFTGTLGRERTYLVHCTDERLELPANLAGAPVAHYRRRADGNLQAAMGPVCTQLKVAIENFKKTRRSSPASPSDEALSRMSTELESLRTEFSAQAGHMRRMMEMLTAEHTSNARTAESSYLRTLEGVWNNPAIGSMAYARFVRGKLRFVYCYGGNHSPSAEMYNWHVFNDALVVRFRWFNKPIAGYAYLERTSPNRLAGGWRSSGVGDEFSPTFEELGHAGRLVPIEWIRLENVSEVPAWAEAFFAQFA
ncbi:TIR domain-containing protein [Hyalangium gracile]|uniref:TIR domain-containing protein n=1 Tax=Hyalangium gracile TaxID=394092 RepID=UPI001CCF2DF6|nr:TIR domain-containing protein [Hyalangium gracile]